MKKMLVTLNDPPYEILAQMARRRGITVQMMLRSVVIPQWLEERLAQAPSTGRIPNLVSTEEASGQAQTQSV